MFLCIFFFLAFTLPITINRSMCYDLKTYHHRKTANMQTVSHKWMKHARLYVPKIALFSHWKVKIFSKQQLICEVLCSSDDGIKTRFEFWDTQNIISKINLFYLQHFKISVGYFLAKLKIQDKNTVFCILYYQLCYCI